MLVRQLEKYLISERRRGIRRAGFLGHCAMCICTGRRKKVFFKKELNKINKIIKSRIIILLIKLLGKEENIASLKLLVVED